MGERKILYRLVIDQGDPLDGYLRVWDGPRGRGVLKDLAGWSGKMQIRADYGAPVILAPVVTCGTFAPVDSRTGQPVTCNVHFSATAGQTGALTDWGMGVFDLQLTDPYGHPWTAARGIALLQREVTE